MSRLRPSEFAIKDKSAACIVSLQFRNTVLVRRSRPAEEMGSWIRPWIEDGRSEKRSIGVFLAKIGLGFVYIQHRAAAVNEATICSMHTHPKRIFSNNHDTTADDQPTYHASDRFKLG